MSDTANDGYIAVHPDLLRDSCGLHGLYDEPECPICVLLAARNVEEAESSPVNTNGPFGI
jgi:hypothetical protein